MNDKYAKQVKSLLSQLYQQSKETGSEDVKQQDFIRGYMAAGLHAGLVDKSSLEAIIDTAHLDVYGMSISQKHYEKMISGEDTTFYDTPTVIRQGVKVNVPN